MGVVNVTPDSFSDGGVYADPHEAVAAGITMVASGADLIDVGGESTRPGAARVSPHEEMRRVLPVIAELAAAGAGVSVDTSRAEVAAAALDAGACLVNDVTGGADPEMFALVAERRVPLVLMHGRGPSLDMQARAQYTDVVAEVRDELERRLAAAVAAGIRTDALILDPGIGFAKNADHNWALLAALDRLHQLGQPLLVGTSRKSFLGAVLRDDAGRPRPVDRRDAATVATTALAAAQGAWAVRVHAVRQSADAVRVAAAWQRARGTLIEGDRDSASLRAVHGSPTINTGDDRTGPIASPLTGEDRG
ncbi:MAG: dihydropteroate synthase [Mycobacterium sp.]|jgi:dihydropteroate synthase|nr:dihydropteroate synthase [Mycobacterium sp.]